MFFLKYRTCALVLGLLAAISNADASVNNNVQGIVESFFEVLNSNSFDNDDLKDLLQGQALTAYFGEDGDSPENSRISQLRALAHQITNPRAVRGYSRVSRLRNDCPGAYAGPGRQGILNCTGGYTGQIGNILVYGTYQGQDRYIGYATIECRNYYGREALFTSHPGNQYCYIWQFSPVIPMAN